MAHDLAGMQAVLVRHVDMNTNLQAGLREAKEQLAGCDRRLEDLTSREARAKTELIRLDRENEELRKRNQELQKENQGLRLTNGELQEENQGTRATLTAREARLIELTGLAAGNQSKLDHTAKLLADAEGKKKMAESWATVAEGRASAAEEQASVLQRDLSTTREELSAAREELSTAREGSSTAREELAKAVEAAAQAVAVYKESKDFEADAAAACVDMYKYGYTDCLTKVQEAHPTLDLNSLALDGEDEEEEEEEEEEELGGSEETAPEIDPEGSQDVPEESVPVIPPPIAGISDVDTSGADGGQKEDGPPAEASKGGDSGSNALEPIVVESPEPDRNQEPPAKEL